MSSHTISSGNEPKTLFFCFGLAKTGTTFLQRLLDLHPEISCPSEHQFELFLTNLNEFVAKYNEVLKKIDRGTGGQGATPISKNAIRLIFRDAFLTVIEEAAKSKRIIGANNNNILQNLEFFGGLFDRPKMIAIFRNPFDTAISSWEHNKRIGDDAILREYGGFPEWVAKTCEWYERDIRSFRRFAQPRGNAVLVKYENLVTNKRATVIDLLRFLGASEDGDIVEDMVARSSIEAFRDNSKNPAFFRKGAVGYGRGEIAEDLRQDLVRKHREALQFLGYGDAATKC